MIAIKKAFLLVFALNFSLSLFPARIFDLQLTPLQDLTVDNATATVKFVFKTEKCILKSKENLPNKGNMMYRVSPSTGEAGYFKIMPISNLKINDFSIYESTNSDGDSSETYQIISRYESEMKIENFPKNFKIYSLLLLDLSGSISKKIAGEMTPPVLDKLKIASKKFVDSMNVGKNKYLAVFAFDGRKELVPVIDYSGNPDEIKKSIDMINDLLIKDYSTNLYGSIYNAIDNLKTRMNTESAVDIKLGTITVFTDGTDRAGWLGKNGKQIVINEINNAKRDYNMYFYSIGLGREIDYKILKEIGRDMFTSVPFSSMISYAFRNAGKRIEELSKCYFMLEYKTPTRSGFGKKDLLIVIKKGIYYGSYKVKFDSSNFKF